MMDDESKINKLQERANRMREALAYMPAGKQKLQIAVHVATIDREIAMISLKVARESYDESSIKYAKRAVADASYNFGHAMKSLEMFLAIESLKDAY